MTPAMFAVQLHGTLARPTAPTRTGALVFARTIADARTIHQAMIAGGHHALLDVAHLRVEVTE